MAASPVEDPPQTTRPRWRTITDSAWFHLIAAFVVAGLVLSFVAKPYVVPSGSMNDTLQPGDRVLVFRMAYLAEPPRTGDVIVFDADELWDDSPSAPENPVKAALRWVGEFTGFGPSSPHTLVKRVIGTPGDQVSCCSPDGAVMINGSPIDEPYVTHDLPFTRGTEDCSSTPRSMRCFGAVTVPPGAYLMLGDNRANSADSALACRGADPSTDCWRWASADRVVGKTVAIIWPPSRWRGF